MSLEQPPNLAAIQISPMSLRIQKRKRRTLFFVDYDDTLLASTLLERHQCLSLDATVPESLKFDLQQNAEKAKAFLEWLLELGKVYIITNSEEGWVKLSAAKFIPEIVPSLEKCRVLSARSRYEAIYPAQPIEWKFAAMQAAYIDETYGAGHDAAPEQIISFGDSQTERQAALRLRTMLTDENRLKVIKFKERPTLDQLLNEIDLCLKCLSHYVEFDRDLDLTLTVVEEVEAPLTRRPSLRESALGPLLEKFAALSVVDVTA